jgi:two-component system, NarL family, nitrate/nitrite response regulator NarL
MNAPVTAATTRTLSSTRLVLVDDHPLVRDGVKALLQGHVQIVGEASCASEALDAVARLGPDVVLTDIGMKLMNGLQLTAELTALHPEVKVIVLSMYDDPGYVQQALRAGARGYVLKDAPGADILTALRQVIEGQVYLGIGVRDRSPASIHRRALSERECDILRCLAQGWSSKQIAAEYSLSVRTVETHRQNIRRKLNLGGQAELICYAVEQYRDAPPPLTPATTR